MESTAIQPKEAAEYSFQAMEALDEQQITDEMKGHIIDSFVYEVAGKTGLSWAGIKAMAERMKNQGQPISVEHMEITQSEDGMTFRAICIAKNLATGEKRTGASEQKRFYDKEMTKEVPFAYVLAGSKAQRNAIRHFLPESSITAAIDEWKSKRMVTQSKYKEVKP